MTTKIAETCAALVAIERCRACLRFAEIEAAEAVAAPLCAGRAYATSELAAKLADAASHADRLALVLQGDIRNAEAEIHWEHAHNGDRP